MSTENWVKKISKLKMLTNFGILNVGRLTLWFKQEVRTPGSVYTG